MTGGRPGDKTGEGLFGTDPATGRSAAEGRRPRRRGTPQRDDPPGTLPGGHVQDDLFSAMAADTDSGGQEPPGGDAPPAGGPAAERGPGDGDQRLRGTG